jgi:Holliday junction resolvase RusA-like endonuclease
MSEERKGSRPEPGGSSFCLRLPVSPRGQERVRFTKTGRAYTPAKTRAATDEIRALWLASGSPVVGGEWFSVEIVAYIERPKSSKHPYPPRPDADNIAKLLMDALQGHAFPNDSRCYSLSVTKRWGAPEVVASFVWE